MTQPIQFPRYIDIGASVAIEKGDVVMIPGDERRWVVQHIISGWAALVEEGWTKPETRPGSSQHHAAERTSKLRKAEQ